MNITRRIALATAVATLTASLSVGAAAADTDPLIEDPADGLELFGTDPERAALIADTLRTLGIEESVVEEIVAAVGRGASLRLGVMLDDGVITEEQLDSLSEHVEDGTLPDDIDQVVEETRARRDAFRAAAQDLLDELGVDLDPDAPVRDALIDNGIDPSEFIARLDDELPPPPRQGEDRSPDPTYPTTPDPTPRPAPTTTTTAAPTTTTTTTTVPAAPESDYPATTPTTVPPVDYPTQEPAPAYEYPETSGGADDGGGEGEESY